MVEKEAQYFQLSVGLKALISDVAQLASVGILALYLIGFVVLNSHLAALGVFNFEFLNLQYLAAGGIAVIAFAIFGFVVGRRIFYGPKDFGELAALGQNTSHPLLWVFFSFAFTIVEIAFGSLVALVWTAGLLYETGAEVRAMSGVLALAAVLDYHLLARPGRYSARPMVTLAIVFAGEVALLAFAVYWLRDPRVLKLAYMYLPAGFVLNFVLDVREKLGTSLAYTFFWAALWLLLAASIFGGTIFGQVKRGIGGGSAIDVRVILSATAPEVLREQLSGPTQRPRIVSLLTESSDEFVFRSTVSGTHEPGTLRVRKDLVAAIAFGASSEKILVRLTARDKKELLR